MKLNQTNELTGDPDKDCLIKLANRMKDIRLSQGYDHYEKFALDNDIARSQYRKYEMGGNITCTNLIKVMKALKVEPAEFFSEGFD